MIVDLDANKTDLIQNVIDYFRKDYQVEITQTKYEFQKGDNQLLIIKNNGTAPALLFCVAHHNTMHPYVNHYQHTNQISCNRMERPCISFPKRM